MRHQPDAWSASSPAERLQAVFATLRPAPVETGRPHRLDARYDACQPDHIVRHELQDERTHLRAALTVMAPARAPRRAVTASGHPGAARSRRTATSRDDGDDGPAPSRPAVWTYAVLTAEERGAVVA